MDKSYHEYTIVSEKKKWKEKRNYVTL